MKHLTFERFARLEITSGDLDPDYIFINRVCKHLSLTPKFKAQWILLKTVVYHAESELRFLFGYENDFSKLAFGMERQKSKHRAAEYWFNINQRFGTDPHLSFSYLPHDANSAMICIEKVSGFGPWAAWKMIDLAACCLGKEFDFNGIDFRRAYDYPLRGMLLINGMDEDTSVLKDDQTYRRVLRTAKAALRSSRRLLAPPDYRRLINIQEMETLFCKYHSYRHGHYEPGEDCRKLRQRISDSPYKKIRNLKALVP